MSLATAYEGLSSDLGEIFQGAVESCPRDIILLVEEEEIPVHKFVLAGRSKYFNHLFSLREASHETSDQRSAASGSQDIVELNDVSQSNHQSLVEISDVTVQLTDNVIEIRNTKVETVRAVLVFIYQGHYDLSGEVETHFLALELALHFRLRDLEEILINHLVESITVENFFDFYNMKMGHKNGKLDDSCDSFLTENGEEIAKSDNFSKLTIVSLLSLLELESFAAAEIDIFRAAERWAGVNKPNKETVQDIVQKIRLATISQKDLFDVVKRSRELPSIDILDAVESIMNKDAVSTNLRIQKRIQDPVADFVMPEDPVADFFMPEDPLADFPTPKDPVAASSMLQDPITDLNVAQSSLGAVVLSGSVTGAALVSGSSGCISHRVGSKPDCIVVKLDKTYRLNTLKLLLDSSKEKSYKYYVDVSVDGKEWRRVVDHSNYWCRSHQLLRFNLKALRLIRMIGINCTILKILSLEAMFTEEEFSLVQGIPVAFTNVVSPSRGATAIGGDYHDPIRCIDGNIESCTSVGYKHPSLIIKLGQPYWLSSLRLNLRNYSNNYCIESSSDGETWQALGCRTDIKMSTLRVWDTFEFSRRVVLHFRVTIKGSLELHHFESPASTTTVTK